VFGRGLSGGKVAWNSTPLIVTVELRRHEQVIKARAIQESGTTLGARVKSYWPRKFLGVGEREGREEALGVTRSVASFSADLGGSRKY
jgi:hypothetical protein